MTWSLPDRVLTLAGSLPGDSGITVRFTPALDAAPAGPGDAEARAEPGGATAGRWLVSAWTRDGTPIFLGRPLAVEADFLYEWAAEGGIPALRFRGSLDPGADAGIASQGVTIEVDAPDLTRPI